MHKVFHDIIPTCRDTESVTPLHNSFGKVSDVLTIDAIVLGVFGNKELSFVKNSFILLWSSIIII